MKRKMLLKFKKEAKMEIKVLKKIEKFAIVRNYQDLRIKAKAMILERKLFLNEIKLYKK